MKKNIKRWGPLIIAIMAIIAAAVLWGNKLKQMVGEIF